MKNIIRVRELSEREIEKLAKRKGFRDFRPVECADCGFKGTFPRRLFLVEGIQDESDRGILRLNMKQNHGIEYCCFRTDGKGEFIETAFCPQCNSNNVVFDLTPDALIKAIKKINKNFLNSV
jgi:predicted Zn-ribbon and HTH transcriptional regulator